MEEKTEKKMHLMPAICTQCGAQLELDADQEAAVCPYCGAAFIVEKAINEYHVQNAHIEHADNVNVDLTGSVDSVLGFAERQLDKHREEKALQRAEDARTQGKMIKMLFLMMAGMMVLGMIMWVIMTVTGAW